MRSGNREVNIFNMSLLDILCGALGAFCFMTIALFPHYGRPKAAENVQNVQANVEQMQKQIEQLIKQLSGGGASAEAVAKALEQLQQLQRQMAQAQQQLAEAQEQIRQYQRALEAADKKIGDLEIRRPVAFQIWFYGENTGADGQDVDLYIQDPFQPPAAPPTLEKFQRPYRPGDVSTRDTVPGSEVWMLRDMPAGEFKVFAKLMGAPDKLKGARAQLTYSYANGGVDVGAIQLTAQKRIGYFGSLVMGRDGKAEFRKSQEILAAPPQPQPPSPPAR